MVDVGTNDVVNDDASIEEDGEDDAGTEGVNEDCKAGGVAEEGGNFDGIFLDGEAARSAKKAWVDDD